MTEFFLKYHSQIQTLAIVLSTVAAVVAAIAAVCLIRHNGSLARQSALINLITAQKTDFKLVDASNIVYRLSKSNPGSLGSYVTDTEDEEKRKIRQAILLVLNNQEFIAVGIRLKAFDENVYKQLQYSSVISLWKATSSFIYAAREINSKPTIFQDFENLARRWEENPIDVLSKRSFFSKLFPGLTK